MVESEIKRIDNTLYGPEIDIPIDGRGLGRTIFDKMKEYGNKILQINAETNEAQTFESVNKKFIRLALEMKNRGVKEGNIVLTCSPNSMDCLLPVYGTMYLNAITVTLDPLISLRDSVQLVSSVSPKLIFVVENAVELIENVLKQLDIKPEIVVMGTHAGKYSSLSDFLKPHPNEDAFIPDIVDDVQKIGIIFFSSGTTGLPKGVSMSNYSALKASMILRCSIADLSVSLYYTSFYWISAYLILTMVILSGSTRIVAKHFSPDTFLKYIQDYKVTFSFLPPTSALQLNEENSKKYKLDSLRELLVSGSSIATEHVKNLFRYFPGTDICLAYGQTEVCGVATKFSKSSISLAKSKLSSCGVPLINFKLKITDLETGKSLGPNEKGEICIKSDTLFSAYHNTITTDIYDNQGFLKTGDIGYYDEDNCLYFCDRMKEMFKYRSWHIVPASLENVIYEHAVVLETVVLGIPHKIDDHHPIALVVLREGYKANEEEILNFVNERVLDREKLRAGVRIVKQLPKTCTGKLHRLLIREKVLVGNFSEFNKCDN